MATLERAIAIAAQAHAGQRDKGGAPYILHALRVMLRVRPGVEQIVAVLHDVVEDSGVTFDDLRAEGYGAEVIDALRSVTKADGESYDEFVARAAKNAVGRAVKLADLADNGDLSRLPAPGAADLLRAEKYRRASAFLLAQQPLTPDTA